MIVNFSVENYGPIKDKQTLSFEAEKSAHLEEAYIIRHFGYRLLKIALIYGPNASGKTNILKALHFLREMVTKPAGKKTDELAFEPFLFYRDTPLENTMMELDFLAGGTRYKYRVVFNKKAVVEETLLFHNRNVRIFERKTDQVRQLTSITIGGSIVIDDSDSKTLQANTLWNNTVLGGYLKTNIEFKELKEVTDWFSNYLRPMVFTSTELEVFVAKGIDTGQFQKEDILEILRKADMPVSDIRIESKWQDIPASFQNLFFKTGSGERLPVQFSESGLKLQTFKIDFVHTVQEERYPLPLEQESRGTQRYFGFAGLLALLINTPCIVPIDELEASLHPDLFKHFLFSFLMNTENSQIIATTHNREILNERDIFRNDAIWLTEKNEEQSTEIYSLADFDTSVIRNTSNILNAYKIGKLGAIPHFEDYYVDMNE